MCLGVLLLQGASKGRLEVAQVSLREVQEGGTVSLKASNQEVFSSLGRQNLQAFIQDG